MLFWCKRISRVLSRVLNTTELRIKKFLLRDCDLQVFEHPHVHVVGCLTPMLSFCTHVRLLSLQNSTTSRILWSLVGVSCVSFLFLLEAPCTHAQLLVYHHSATHHLVHAPAENRIVA